MQQKPANTDVPEVFRNQDICDSLGLQNLTPDFFRSVLGSSLVAFVDSEKLQKHFERHLVLMVATLVMSKTWKRMKKMKKGCEIRNNYRLTGFGTKKAVKNGEASTVFLPTSPKSGSRNRNAFLAGFPTVQWWNLQVLKIVFCFLFEQQ